MAFFGKYWNEARELTSLAVPTTMSMLFEAAMIVEDVIMLGHLGKGHMAALSFRLLLIMMGTVQPETFNFLCKRQTQGGLAARKLF